MTRLQATFALALFGAIFAAPGLAHADPGDQIYTTVDSYRVDGDRTFFVNGILQGASAATEQNFSLFTADSVKRCDALALLAMSRPGKYLLRIDMSFGDYVGCTLIRR